MEKKETLIFGLSKPEVILLSSILVACIIMIIAVIEVFKFRKLSERERNAKIDKISFLIYDTLNSIPITRKFLNRCYERISKLSVKHGADLKREVAAAAAKSTITFLAVSLLGMFIVQNWACRAVLFVLAYLIAKQMLNKRISKLNLLVLTKLSQFIGVMREEFLRYGDILSALDRAEKPAELKASLDEIVEIMGSADSEYRLGRFMEHTYCDYVKTFAIACVKIADMGEERSDGDEPTFIRVLKFLEEDINAEIERRQYSLFTFGSLEITNLIPLIGIDLLPMVMSNALPGLNVVYEAMSGYLIKFAVALSATVGYYLITMLSQIDDVAADDRVARFENYLDRHDWAKKLSIKAAPKKLKKHRMEALMQKSLTKKSLISISFERMIYAAIAFFATIIICVIATMVQKSYAIQSTQTFGMINNDDTAKWEHDYIIDSDNKIMNIMLETAGGDTSIKARNIPIKDEEILEQLSGSFPGLTDLQLDDQLTRIKKKYDLINSAYFHWYFILVAYGIAILAFFIPTWMLKFRAWNIKKQEQEEFLSLQTLCTIIAISDCDVLDALESMYKMAKLYKERLLECYLRYCVDPAKELARLESKVELDDFKRLIKKMELGIDEISLKEAFEGMEIERKHIVTLREQQSKKSINEKRVAAGMISKVAMAVFVVGEMVFPVLYVGITELVKTFGSLQDLMG